MRIISGCLGGRRLHTVEGEGYRPAMGKTREALFSMLLSRGMRFDGARVLDLFAGSGSLGFEALSRGAGEAVFVENAPLPARCLARNMEELAVRDRARLLRDDVRKGLLRSPAAPVDLVFIDPPYRKNLINVCLTALEERGWLAQEAFISAELEKGAPFRAPENWEPLADRVFGQTRLLLWKRA